MSAIENVGEVDDIACTGVEVGNEVNSALVIILCRGILLVAGTRGQKGYCTYGWQQAG